MDYSRFKPKRQKGLEIALILSVVIMIMGVMVFSSSNDDDVTESDSTDQGWIKWIIIAAVILFIIYKKKPDSTLQTDEQIIKHVADEIYNSKGIYLSTKNSNVRVQRGAPEETYVEFLDECITYLYLEGIGIIERYPGESIKIVKKGKQEDQIQMKLAEIGIARKKHMETLENYGLVEEEA